MKLYVARDKGGRLYLYENKPTKHRTSWDECTGFVVGFDSDSFPEVKWEDEEPTEVELIIKKLL